MSTGRFLDSRERLARTSSPISHSYCIANSCQSYSKLLDPRLALQLQPDTQPHRSLLPIMNFFFNSWDFSFTVLQVWERHRFPKRLYDASTRQAPQERHPQLLRRDSPGTRPQPQQRQPRPLRRASTMKGVPNYINKFTR